MIPAVTQTTARISGAAGTVLRNAFVATLDAEIGSVEGGDVYFDGGTIQSVGVGLDVPEGTEEIDAEGSIVIPGLIDSHRHPWQTLMRGMATDYMVIEYRDLLRGGVAPRYRPEDVYAGTLLGDFEAINSGVTTVADLAHIMNSPNHADAAIQAHHDSGLRTLFAYGTPNDGDHDRWYRNSATPHPSDIKRVRSELLSSDEALVTLGMHIRPPFLVTPDVMKADFELAQELDLHVSMDGGLGGGCWGGEPWGGPGRRPIQDLDDAGLLSDRLTLVHCNNLPSVELARIADSGAHVSISPDAEMNCGHGEPATLKLLAHGIKPGLSIDSVVWASGDLFTAMRAVINSARGRLGTSAYETGTPLNSWDLVAEDVLKFATHSSAAACGLDDRIGSITPGKKADLVILRSDPFNLEPMNHPIGSVVMSAHPGNVDTVFINGKCVKRNGKLLNARAATAVATAREARNHVLGDFTALRDKTRDPRAWEWV